MKVYRSSEEVTEFHAHIYFDAVTRASALSLHETMLRFHPLLKVHTMAEGSRGPHVLPMFGMDIPKEIFAIVVSFLALNRGPHSVLFHPLSGNELLDHTHHALWLGPQQPLNLAVLA